MQMIDGKNHHISVHGPEVGLSVSLFSSMTEVQHHPSVSFFLRARRQGGYISWSVTEYKVIFREEMVICVIGLLHQLLTEKLKQFILVLRFFEKVLPVSSLWNTNLRRDSCSLSDNSPRFVRVCDLMHAS